MHYRYRFAVVLISITAAVHAQQVGIPSDGREYFLGIATPSVEAQLVGGTARYGVNALITSLGENVVTVSYIGTDGAEFGAHSYRVSANTSLQVPLDLGRMSTASVAPDQAAYNTCHIVATAPISVLCYSSGGCAGGSYLALPLQCWGKRYVVMSYTDNPAGIGGIVSNERSRGGFQVIAASNATRVTITPSTTTAGGHIGAISGAGSDGTPRPFDVVLDRGQSVTIYSDGSDASNDITGSQVTANKPVAVLAMHENAFPLAGSVGSHYDEGRDFMMEQLIPAECWDTSSVISIPFVDSGQPAEGGEGEEIRIVGLDPSASTAVNEATTGATLSVNPFSTVSRSSVTTAQTYRSTQAFGAMMYDQRMQGASGPYPAPSMLSLVPSSRWKSEFAFVVPPTTGMNSYASYLTLIVPKWEWDQGNLLVSVNGAAFTTLQSAGISVKRMVSIPDEPYLRGFVLSIGPGAYRIVNARAGQAHPYYREDTLTFPMMAYGYGMRAYSPDGDVLDESGDDFFTEYASPLGMSYGNSSIPRPTMSADVADECTRWHVCLHSTGAATNGIRYIELLNYANYESGAGNDIAHNVMFDPSLDPLGKGEIVLDGAEQDYCFDVLKRSQNDTAFGSIVFYDNSGRGMIVPVSGLPTLYAQPSGQLGYGANRTYTFGTDTLGSTRCGGLVLYANQYETGSAEITSIHIAGDTSAFHITNALPAFPLRMEANSSIWLELCSTTHALDTSSAEVVVEYGCRSQTFRLSADATSGYIHVEDIRYHDTKVGAEECSTLVVTNTGNAPLWLDGYRLNDTSNFRVKPNPKGYSLPHRIVQGDTMTFTVCFRPTRADTLRTELEWLTSVADTVEPPLPRISHLSGRGFIPVDDVAAEPEEDIDLMASFSDGTLHINMSSTLTGDASVCVYDLIGRQVWSIRLDPGWSGGRYALSHLATGSYLLRFETGRMHRSIVLHVQ